MSTNKRNSRSEGAPVFAQIAPPELKQISQQAVSDFLVDYKNYALRCGHSRGVTAQPMKLCIDLVLLEDICAFDLCRDSRVKPTKTR